MNIILRIAEEKDFPAILELIREMADFENMSDKLFNSVERMKAEKEYLNCFVAETTENKIIAYATYFFTYHTFIGKCLYMDDLYVKSDYRGNGIGLRLMNKVIEFAKENQCHKLRWQVSSWNEGAKKFYKNLGAQIDGIEQNCDLLLS